MVRLVNADVPLYVLAVADNRSVIYEFFTSLEMANERFVYLTTIKYTSMVSKIEIRAFYSLLTSDMIKGLEEQDEETIKNVESQVKEIYERGKLIRTYPRAKRLKEILPYLTAEEMSKATGMTFPACEKLLFEPMKFDMFSFEKLSRICNVYNLSIYLFFR